MATSGSPSLDVNTIATVVAGVVSSLQSQAPSTHAHAPRNCFTVIYSLYVTSNIPTYLRVNSARRYFPHDSAAAGERARV